MPNQEHPQDQSLPQQPRDRSEGEALGAGYRLFGRLGGGAMGEVRMGRTTAGEAVAVKVLRPEFAEDPAMVARFLQERSILTGLSHENVVQVRDLVAEGTTLAIVMDLVDGPDLRTQLLARGTLPPGEAAAITSGVLRGLAAVHSAGVVHRDVKPENVLLDMATHPGYSVPRVTDFGISKLINQKSAARRTSVIGTPEYMAPELIDDIEPTASSDLYSVGIMLYELLTGVTPFGGGNPLAVLRKHAELEPGRPDGIPDPLWEIIADLLAKDPTTRPLSAALVATSLDAQLAQLAELPALPKLTEPPTAQPDVRTVIKSISQSQPAPNPPKKRGPLRGLLVGVSAVALIAAVAGGAYWLLPKSEGSDGASVASSSSGPPTPSQSAPSASGLAIPAYSPSFSADPTSSAFATASPSGGVPVAVSLGVMPDVLNTTVADASAELATMGIEPKLTWKLDTSVPDGTVIEQTPESGRDIYETVELTVARREQTVWLADQAPVSGDPGMEPVNVNGKNYVHTLVKTFSWCSSEAWEYDLGRSYSTLKGTVGLTDDSDSASRVAVEIYRDGIRLFDNTVSLGDPAKFDVDITGGLRLKLVMTPRNCGDSSTRLAWVNARLTGIPALTLVNP